MSGIIRPTETHESGWEGTQEIRKGTQSTKTVKYRTQKKDCGVSDPNKMASHLVQQCNQSLGETCTWTWLNVALEHLIGARKKQAIRASSGKQNRTPAGISNIEGLEGGVGGGSLKWLRVFPRHLWGMYLNNVQIHTRVSRDLFEGWEDDRV